MRKFLFVIGLFVGVVSIAQTTTNQTKTVFIDNVDSVCNNLIVSFPVRAKNFANITGIQGTIKWDSTVLKFDTLLLNTNTSIIKFYDTTTNLQLANGFLTFLWVDSNATGVTIPDSSILFTLRLKVINAVNYATPIYFSSNPTNLEIVATDSSSGSFAVTDTAWQSGYIRFIDTPKIIQNGNVFTCISNCTPTMYVWNIYDSSGVLIKSDTTLTNTYVYTNLSTNSNDNVTVIVYYSNGNRIASSGTPIKPLPLKLISFNAKLQTPNSVLLNWQTTNEINISHISIQRSMNSKEFINIGKLNAGKNNYEFTDLLPTKNLVSSFYYRLEIIDKDGSKTYSNVKKVAINNEKLAINIYPNPATAQVYISCLNAKELVITDYLGKLMINKKNTNTEQNIINVQGFAKGIYIVKLIMTSGETKTEKLVVE